MGDKSKISVLITIAIISFLITTQFLVVYSHRGEEIQVETVSTSEIESIETDHFIVNHPKDAALMGERVARIAEEVYEDATSLMNYEPDFKTQININLGTSNAFARDRRIELFLTPPLTDIWLADWISHEFTHVLQREFSDLAPGSQPFWLIEGMAKYAETENGYNYSGTPYHRYLLTKLANEDNLRSLLDMEDPDQIESILYSSGYAVFVYLKEEYGDRSLDQFIEGFKAWDFNESLQWNMDEIFQGSVGMSYQEFDDQWLNWLKEEYTFDYYFDDLDAHSLLDGASHQILPCAWYNDTVVHERFVSRSFNGYNFVHNLYRQKITETTGNKVTRSGSTVMEEDARFSSDGEHLIFTSYLSGSAQIYRLNYSWEDDYFYDRRKLTEGDMNFDPTYGPDDRIAFTSSRNGNNDIFQMDSNGNDVKELVSSDHVDISPSYSPDGSELVFSSDRDGAFNLYILDIEEEKITQLTDTSKDEVNPRWSPEGEKIAFVRSGKYSTGGSEICLIDVDGEDISSIEDDKTIYYSTARPTWDQNGTRLLFAVFKPDGVVSINYIEVDYEEEDEEDDTWSIPGFDLAVLLVAMLSAGLLKIKESLKHRTKKENY